MAVLDWRVSGQRALNRNVEPTLEFIAQRHAWESEAQEDNDDRLDYVDTNASWLPFIEVLPIRSRDECFRRRIPKASLSRMRFWSECSADVTA